MKKMRMVVLALMLIVMMSMSCAFAAVPGDTVTVDIILSNTDAVIFDLGSVTSYDSSAISIVSQNPGAGRTFLDFDGMPIASGKIGTVTVKVLENAKPGTYTISFGYSGALNAEFGAPAMSISAKVNVACTHPTEEVIPGKAPTCVDTGLSAGKKCTVCGEITEEQKVAAALGHIEDAIPAVPATCTETGLTAGKKCSVCEEILEAQKVTPVIDHTYGEWVVDKEANCTETGAKIKTCVCGAFVVEEIPVNGKHNEEVIPAVAATCTKTGLTEGKKCLVCGEVLVAQEVTPVIDHTYGEWIVDQEATCVDAGAQLKYCECGAFIVEEIPATGVHTEESIPAVAATCTVTGLTEGKKCSVCEAILVAQEVIPVIDHTYGEWIVAQEATCGVAGLQIKYCDCGAYVSEEIPATGAHTEVVIPAVDATCTEAGMTAGKLCSACNAVLVAQEEVAATGHDYYLYNTVAPTADKKGYDQYKCKNCGEIFHTNFKDKLNGEPETGADTEVAPETEAATTVVTVIAAEEIGDIVFNASGENVPYECVAEEAETKTLKIIASADEDGKYTLRMLCLSFELVAKLEEDGFDAIVFVVGEYELVIPMDIFAQEMLQMIVKDLGEDTTGYAFTVDSNAEGGCLVKAEVQTADGYTDVASFVIGLVLCQGENEVEVTESKAYNIEVQ